MTATFHTRITAACRVAVYCRVSSDEQAMRGTIGIQKDAAERYIATNALTLANVYADDGVSGTIPFDLRPAGAQLLQDARAGKFKTLLIWKLDRLGRDPGAIITMTALQALYQCGVTVVSLTESVDLSTPEGWFMAVLLAGAAGLERQNILLRSKAGTERKLKQGMWMGGPIPFGYLLDDDGKLTPHDAPIPGQDHSEADVIRLIYHLSATERQTNQKIADHLSALGIPTPAYRDGVQKRRGPQPKFDWSFWHVRGLITNPIYKGEYHFGRSAVKQGRDREIIVTQVPALVSPERWEEAQTAMANNKKLAFRSTHTRLYLLRGLVRCGTCGCTYLGTCSTGRRGESRPYYRCSGMIHFVGEYGAKRQRCPSTSVRAEYLEALIWRDIEGFLRDPGEVITRLASRFQAERNHAEDYKATIATMQGRVQALNQERDAILTLFRKGRIAEQQLDSQLDQIAAEERVTQERIAELSRWAHSAELEQARLTDARTLLMTLSQRLDSPLDWPTKRLIVERLVRAITIETIASNGKRAPIIHVTYAFGQETKRAVEPTARNSRIASGATGAISTTPTSWPGWTTLSRRATSTPRGWRRAAHPTAAT